MPETVGQHKNGCPKGKTQSRGPLSRRLLCIMFTDKRNAGLLADFFLGWHRHAKRGRKGEAGRWCVFSLAEILTGTGLSKNQWRDAKPWLEGAVRIVGGGNMGKRAIWVQPTAQLERFVAGAGDYPDKKAARRALEALRQAPVEPVGTTQAEPVGHSAGHNQGHHGGQNPILSTLSSLSAHGDTKNQTFDLEKEKPGKIPQSAKVGPESKITPPTPQPRGPWIWKVWSS
jgi:hypothetical protein